MWILLPIKRNVISNVNILSFLLFGKIFFHLVRIFFKLMYKKFSYLEYMKRNCQKLKIYFLIKKEYILRLKYYIEMLWKFIFHFFSLWVL